MTKLGESCTYAGEMVEEVSAGSANVCFDERGLVPAVVQQESTGEVLMVAWMNAESLRLTQETGTTWFWSRSRQELWNKGATSGHVQRVVKMMGDCDDDTLIYVGTPKGPVCHTGHRTCFFTTLWEKDEK